MNVTGQIFLIICIQSIIESFIDAKKKPQMVRMLSIACYVGCMYILLNFVYDFLFVELNRILSHYF